MILTDEICDRLCAAAREKSREVGIDISFAVCDENGLPRVYRRFGEALVLSITLVPGKAYTASIFKGRKDRKIYIVIFFRHNLRLREFTTHG